MSVREFAHKVWQYRSLPPLWMWRPPWLRRAAMVVMLPIQFALYLRYRAAPLCALHGC